jgi:hypothetical protein
MMKDCELTSAKSTDLEADFELLYDHTDLEVWGDNTYIGATKVVEL